MTINTHLVKMPNKVKATYCKNEDDSYSVFINDKLSMEQQQKAYKHELRHILNEGKQKYCTADEIERETH